MFKGFEYDINIKRDILKLFQYSHEVEINNKKHKFTKAEKILYLGYLSRAIYYDVEFLGTTIPILNRDMAKVCSLDETTICNSKKVLLDLNMIEVDEKYGNSYCFKFKDYDPVYITGLEHNYNYINIKMEIFNKLKNLNVNELNVAINIILAITNKRNRNAEFVSFNYYNTMKNLGKYINCRSKVKSIYKNIADAFNEIMDVYIDEDFCLVKIKK